MLYRRTPELPPLRYIQNGITGAPVYPTGSTQTVLSAGELFLKSLWLEVSLTKDENCQLPATGPDKCRTIVSRKYNADMSFRSGLNEISGIFAKITNLSSSSIEANFITATNVTATTITTLNISAQNGNISVLHSNDITSQKLVVDNGKIENISGLSVTYQNGQIEELSSTDISTRNITAYGRAELSAAATYWADLAELYESDTNFDPGTLVRFNGENEIEIASDGIANGVISKNPAMLMNTSLKESTANPVILIGRSVVKIKDKISKFDRIELSNVPGVAQKAIFGSNKKILGISLESKSDIDIRPVECVVKIAI